MMAGWGWLTLWLIIKKGRIQSMEAKLSHDRADESIEAKARWYQSLTLTERMEIFCAVTDLALELNPQLADKKYAQQTQGRVRVLSAA